MDLLKFCYPNDTRPEITKPWHRGQWTFATDGRIFIRVPRVEGIEEAKGIDGERAEDVKALCDIEPIGADHLPAFEGKPIKRVCESCYIAEVITDDCPECRGRGILSTSEWDGCPADFRGVELNGKYLHLIASELPNPRLFSLPPAPKVGTGDAVGIVFDGGRGVLMGMRKGSIADWKRSFEREAANRLRATQPESEASK